MSEAKDMVSVLVKDHEEIKEFFKEIESATDAKSRRDAADKLTAEVARHSVAEEMYLYPAARDALPNGDKMVDEEIKEHSEAEELLKRWEKMDGDDPEFMSTFQQIKQGLLHHIDEEEEPKLFPEMQAALSQEQQDELGEKITKAKKLAPTRPHPSAPNEPPADKVLGVPLGIVDRIRDKMSGRETG
ncbi:MAG TPA: hemerythrin domain-containing protein [Marmoricola sp.]|nr:hemerythrin domain-containing protein [Marmoricola sp.]